MDKNFSFLYDAEVGKELELYGAEQYGIEQGKQQLITKLVLKMASLKKTTKEISDILEISIEEVEKILEKNKS